MITKNIEGIDWQLDSPHLFVHGDVAVYFVHSPYTNRRYWQINVYGEGDLEGYYATRYAAMSFAKHYVIGQQRSM